MSQAIDHTESRVLLTGGTGFIGGHLLRAAESTPGLQVRVLVRDPARLPITAASDVVVGDLGDPEILRSALDGIDTVVHAAAYLGSDPEEQLRTNRHGTSGLLRAAALAGVERFVSVSTAAVYGTGPHRGLRPSQLPLRPESELSRSRLHAEELVLDAGGTVIRPHLVYGSGDRRVLPALLRFTAALDAVIEDGAPRVSAIRADHLARLILALLLLPDAEAPRERILHAATPAPPSVAEILAECERTLGVRVPRENISAAEAIERATRLGVTPHQASMIAVDGWFDAAELWAIGGLAPDTPFALDAAGIEWYRALLTTDAHR